MSRTRFPSTPLLSMTRTPPAASELPLSPSPALNDLIPPAALHRAAGGLFVVSAPAWTRRMKAAHPGLRSTVQDSASEDKGRARASQCAGERVDRQGSADQLKVERARADQLEQRLTALEQASKP